jgi:glucosamine-6-phosphate deaminase
MARAALRVFPTPDAIGEELAARLLSRIDRARIASRQFLLGWPTGRSPKPLVAAMARRLAAKPQDLSHVVFVMMDEYLVRRGEGDELGYAPADAPWSCHWFARFEIRDRLNGAVPEPWRVRAESTWFPDPANPAEYDSRIEAAGGIDYFILASGASDGHVAFNQPGSPRDSRTRIIPLSEQMRRDNLATFPAFGTLETVPRHGISVGIETIVKSREAAMIAFGEGKRLTVERMRGANRYEPDWPATLVHEFAACDILCDTAASVGAER